MLKAKLSRLVICVVLILGLSHSIINYLLYTHDTSPHIKDDIQDITLRNIKHIEDLQRIKRSITTELRELEMKRNNLQEEITASLTKSKDSERESKQALADLNSLKRQILQQKNERLELLRHNVVLPPPLRLLASSEDNVDVVAPKSSHRCRMYNCFDYSRCSLTSKFPVYIYSPKYTNDAQPILPLKSPVVESVIHSLKNNVYVTADPNIACLYVVFIGEVNQEDVVVDVEEFEQWLSKLPYWRGDGRNHVIVHLSKSTANQNLLVGANTGRAMLAQSSFLQQQYRAGFDVVLPSQLFTYATPKVLHDEESDAKHFTIQQVPVIREYFLTFQGHWIGEADENIQGGVHSLLMDNLEKMLNDKRLGNILIQTTCEKESTEIVGSEMEWQICGTPETRISILSKSTFSLIITPDNEEFVSTTLLVTRLAESLYSGAIPVILGTQLRLPFHDFIDWTRAAVIWPKPRITELPYLLSTYPHADIFALRSQGQFLYDQYFRSTKSVLDAMLALVRTRLNIPPEAIDFRSSVTLPHQSYNFVKEVAPGDAQSEFGVPPPEGKVDSMKFVHNFTVVTTEVTDYWNKFPGPFQLYPSTPFEKILPSDAKFQGSSAGFKPIAEGRGAVGEEYQKALGGNVPGEQFTIVILTYKRDEVLIQALQRLKGLPHLNKVVVVWNSPKPPDHDLQWPDLGIDVVVIRSEKNSLNNRFLPYTEIDTDAVLSLDDDAHLRHDEILLSFRVWREQRDRIVGFPGRFHSWDISKNEWEYNSDYCCELSMVLTGAAFFHKYYMYLYTNWMPQVIKDKVDEYMNCEDIAMNYLVSHITRAPPVKVTSRWTFRCTSCDDALSESHHHFEERHICINYFTKVFGYMPLLSTQFRTDSILFKTRLPSNKQKCFKFI